jgi:hypothetical protein
VSDIFISYRREDSLATAGRIHDRLVKEFGRQRVFVDVDGIDHGQDFLEAIEAKIASCKVVLAVIGPKWIDVRDAEGRRRLDQSDDIVTQEIAMALAPKTITLIPVLVDGAQMPAGDALPPALRALARRSAIELRNTQFESDALRLIAAIERVTGRARFWPRYASATGIAVGLCIVAYVVWAMLAPVNTRTSITAPPPARSDDVATPSADQKRESELDVTRLREVLLPAEGRVYVGIKNGNRVRLGDLIVFEIRSQVSGRLILVDVNAAGSVTQIFPNRFLASDAAQHVTAGLSVTVPGPDYGFSGFKAVEPAGPGRLIALIVPDDTERFALVSEQASKGFEPVNAPGAYFAQIVERARAATKGMNLQNWAFALTDYEIVR